jgi:NitT/TauT family transport system substrate-binding protein
LNFLLFLLVALVSFTSRGSEKVILRVGHFPNVTHAQAVIAHGLSRTGKGWFEERLGPDVQVQWFVYNAGP